jgi:carboxylesterase type B
MRGYRRRAAPVLLFSILGLGAAPPPAAASPSDASSASPQVVVRTHDGVLRGAADGAVDSFLGVRYAGPPTGRFRWEPPRPVQPWLGVADATAYANRCPAAASTNGPESLTEDCLFLNVQRPSGTSRAARLAVFVWIHGGGFTNGSSNQHDGSKIVRETGIVVVTLNYRLGVLGFLAHPALTAAQGESGDYGFMDQQAALRWVHRNIAAFGGDPDRVTIGGESAGGISVCAHLSAPGSQHLFAGAVIQSGNCATQSLSDAESAGVRAAAAVGCPTTAAADAISCLRAVPTAQLINTPLNAWPVRGGPTIPADPGEAIKTGAFARVPVLIGANRDEGRTFTQGDVGQTQAQYESVIRNAFGPVADAVLAQYPWPGGSDPWTGPYLEGAIITDGSLFGLGGCANRDLSNDLARHTPTFSYQFDHRDGPGLTPLPGYVWGAGHAAELAYLWPSFDNGAPIAPTFNAGERRLAHDMVAYWGSFVRHGNPGTVDDTRWPRLQPDAGPDAELLSLRAGGQSTPISDATLAAQHKCAFWNSLG